MKIQKLVALAEDEEILREICTIRLERAGFNVQSFADGLSLLTWLSDNKPDVVVLDILMPEMNGFEVLEAIHKNFADKNIEKIPVIVYSNLVSQADVQKAFDKGAKKVVKKVDVDPADLAEMVKELF